MTAPLIALLDNDPAFLAQMHTLLTAAGYRTLRCRPRDVRSVHALVTRHQPALVILDRRWRRTDGWGFLTDLWADPATMRIGVVLACGQALPSSLHAEILRATRCQIVRNPLDRDELLRAIEAVVAPTPMQRERGPQHPVLPFAEPAVSDLLESPSSRRARTDDAHFFPFPFPVRWWFPPSPHPSPFLRPAGTVVATRRSPGPLGPLAAAKDVAQHHGRSGGDVGGT